MKFAEFEAAARKAFDEIPPEYLEGIDGLVVSKEAVTHPDFDDLYTLGECATEVFISDVGGPESTRSTVYLHWGSFVGVSEQDPDFDWEGELWETLTHELRHHLESLAGEDALEGVDYVVSEDAAREDGDPWDPFYYQRGEVIAPSVFEAEGHVFIEWELTEAQLAEFDAVEFEWAGRSYLSPAPDELGDVHYILIDEGVADAPRILELVLLRKRSWRENLSRMLKPRPPRVLESVATAVSAD